MNTKFRLRDNPISNALIEIMLNNLECEGEPMLGFFWYDTIKKEPFGVHAIVLDGDFSQSEFFPLKARTDKYFHRSFYKSAIRKSSCDRRFLSRDYKMIPRGRIFQLEDGSFKIAVGDWAKSCPELKDTISAEFNLPADKTELFFDRHWDIGQGIETEW